MEMGNARRRLQSVLEDYVSRSQIAQVNRRKEHVACIKLQCAWRRKQAYLLLRKWNNAATFIQRVYRGHLGRERHSELSRRRDKALRMAYFNARATRIQKWYRGYYSRKYVHSFYARREFLAKAMDRAAAVQSEFTNNYKEQCVARFKTTERRAKDEIERFNESSHSMLGTLHVKGMYYSPYLAVLGKPNQIEDDIRETRKRHNNVEDMKAIRRMKEDKVKDPEVWKHRFITTIGPYCPYFTQYEARMKREKQSSLLQISEKDFRTTLRDRTNIFKGRSLRCETPYLSPYEFQRVQTKKKKVLRLSLSELPFFVSVPGDRKFSQCVKKADI